MRNSRLTLCLLGLFVLQACGLLAKKAELPPLAMTYQAREAESSSWDILQQAYLGVQGDLQAGLPAAQALLATHPEDVRLAIFVQDVEISVLGSAAVQKEAMRSFQQDPSPLHAFLAARAQTDAQKRYRLLTLAVEDAPDFVQARVFKLAMEARAGEPEVLDELIALLNQHPGSAEAWRLLADLAPLYDRLDLARAAAQTEPWSPLEKGERATYTLALADLKNDNAKAALEQARQLPEDMWEARLLEASALAKLGRPVAAIKIVDALLQTHPQEPAVWFDKALLLRDYLGRSKDAVPYLEKFLDLSKASGQANLMRVTQAQLWLSLEHQL